MIKAAFKGRNFFLINVSILEGLRLHEKLLVNMSLYKIGSQVAKTIYQLKSVSAEECWKLTKLESIPQIDSR